MAANLTAADKERAQRITISALARGATNAESAGRAGVAVRTIVSWKQDDAFRAQIAAEQAKLEEREPEAIGLLRRALHDPKVTSPQIAAAKLLLELLPDEVPASQPAEITFFLDSDAIERVLQHRRDAYRTESAEFMKKQAEDAARIERLYRRDENPPKLRAVKEPEA